jgi:Flp pilus assembly protein TadG
VCNVMYSDRCCQPPRPRRRRGAAAIEFAFVAPVVLFIILAQIFGGMCVFRYQEVAHLAREGARYASTHGATYVTEGTAGQTGEPDVDSSEDLRTYLAARTVLLSPSSLQVDVSWTAPGSVVPANQPTYLDPDPNQVPPGQRVIQNYVIVKVSYSLKVPGIPSALTLTSTSQMPMCY